MKYSAKILLLITAILNLLLPFTARALPSPTVPAALFLSGDAGYACFRIPAIVQTPEGTLIAFAEGRKKGCSDTGDIDLVMRRSIDHGKTWSPLLVIWDSGDDVAGNPAPVVDAQTGTIFLLSTWNLAKEITNTVKLPEWTWYATGPVHGIQLTGKSWKNRLMIPCDHIEAGSKRYFSHIIYSDDHGATWKPGGTTPQDQVNECTVAELADGKLMLNMRNYNRTQKNRKLSLSEDGGATWSGLRDDPRLIEPICQAALLTIHLKGRQTALAFLNPADSLSRQNLELKISRDAGSTWQLISTVHAGPAAYSDLVQVNKREIGCLFEAGEKSAYEGIWFMTIEI